MGGAGAAAVRSKLQCAPKSGACSRKPGGNSCGSHKSGPGCVAKVSRQWVRAKRSEEWPVSGPFDALVVVGSRMERLEEERSLPGCSNAMLQEIMRGMD